jgi:cytochrome P450
MTTTSGEPLVFNPFDPALRSNPYPVYNRFREEDPVHQSPLGIIVLSRWADCAGILRHPRVSSDNRKAEGWAEEARAQGIDPDAEVSRPFLFMDPPDHTRLRGLVNKAFTPRTVERLRPRAEALVKELIDARIGSGEIDIIEDLAYPLPVTIISEMLGVPPEDRETFKEWSKEFARALDPDEVLPPETIERRQKAGEEFSEFFRRLIEKRRAEPQDDLVSELVAAEDAGNKLTEQELITTCILLLIAGHETTVNLIGNGMLTLLRHPDQLAMLRDDPSLAKTAVEEVLRYDPPVQLTGRIALEDITLESGAVIPKGKQAVLLLGAANRDPAQFADPERVDITREDNRHLAFGMGIHFCLGAPLARVEGQIALAELARRLRNPRLMTDPPPYKENITLRGLASLPVAFDAG